MPAPPGDGRGHTPGSPCTWCSSSSGWSAIRPSRGRRRARPMRSGGPSRGQPCRCPTGRPWRPHSARASVPSGPMPVARKRAPAWRRSGPAPRPAVTTSCSARRHRRPSSSPTSSPTSCSNGGASRAWPAIRWQPRRRARRPSAAGAAAAAVAGGGVPDVGSAAANEIQRPDHDLGRRVGGDEVCGGERARAGRRRHRPEVHAEGAGVGGHHRAPPERHVADVDRRRRRRPTPGYPAGSPNKASIALGAGSVDPGRAIDRGDSGDADTLPNTNPLYAVENTPGNVSATLTDVGPHAGFGSHVPEGRRRRQRDRDGRAALRHPTEAPPLREAGVAAEVRGDRAGARRAARQHVSGLGRVGLEVRRERQGHLDPEAIRVVREGPPTAAFMEAAKKWNGQLHRSVDRDGLRHRRSAARGRCRPRRAVHPPTSRSGWRTAAATSDCWRAIRRAARTWSASRSNGSWRTATSRSR